MSNTVDMQTIIIKEPTAEQLMMSYEDIGILRVPTLQAIDGLDDSMDYSPRVTAADLSFVASAEAALLDTLVNPCLDMSNISVAGEPEYKHVRVLSSTDNQVSDREEQDHEQDIKQDDEDDQSNMSNGERTVFIPYETLEEMYANLNYDEEASEDEYF